jgi:hypothetical protein
LKNNNQKIYIDLIKMSEYYSRFYYETIDYAKIIVCEIKTSENHWITNKIFKIENSLTESHLCYFYDVEKLYDNKNNATPPFNIVEHNNDTIKWYIEGKNNKSMYYQFESMINWLNNPNIEKRMKELYF